MDTTFQITLCFMNMAVALMNLSSYINTDDKRDLAAAVAWFGSTGYWLWRAMIS